MHGLLKQPGYRLYEHDSPEARTLLAEQGLGPADLHRALARLGRAEGTTLRTIVGLNEDGVFGTGREGWRPDLSDALQEPFIPLLKVHELLGRVPTGSRPVPRGWHAVGLIAPASRTFVPPQPRPGDDFSSLARQQKNVRLARH